MCGVYALYVVDEKYLFRPIRRDDWMKYRYRRGTIKIYCYIVKGAQKMGAFILQTFVRYAKIA